MAGGARRAMKKQPTLDLDSPEANPTKRVIHVPDSVIPSLFSSLGSAARSRRWWQASPGMRTPSRQSVPNMVCLLFYVLLGSVHGSSCRFWS